MRNVKAVFVLVVLLLLLILTIQNTEVVTIRFLTWDVSLSRIVLIGGAFAAGLVTGLVGGAWNQRSRASTTSGTGS